MNKILYLLLIVFFSINTATGIWNFIITFQTGIEIYKLDSYNAWFLCGNITAIVGSVLLFKYYLHNNFRLAFFTGIIGGIANLCYFTVCYINLTSAALRSYYLPALFLYLSAIIIYMASLIFSDARKRYWLKLAGIFGVIITLVLALSFIGSAYSKNALVIARLQKTIRWSSIAACLANVLFIMNFIDELWQLNTKNTYTLRKKYLETTMGLYAIVAIVFTIAIGTT